MEAESQAGAGSPFDGTFRLLDELGRGSRGVVFHALQQPLDEPVAIKVLHERLGEDAPGREQFNEEVRAFAGLDHPNLVSIGSFGIAGEAPYIVMELLDGETVAARLARGPIDPSEAETLIQTMLRAVAHLHLRGLVHKNLSPGAIFLHRKDDREQLKLIDYGLSRLTETSDDGRVALPSPYVSPEQAAGEDTDARTDVYAAGAIMMRLFGAAPPPMAANDNGSARPSARVHPGASPQLDALVARALAPNRQERFGNADQMLKALLELPSPWISAEGSDETSENDAIPLASNAPAPDGVTTEVSVPDAEPTAARHNTPPPIPGRKQQTLPVLKMIAAALVGALLAGGGVAYWVMRKDAALKAAEAQKAATLAPKPADTKPEPHAAEAKKAEAKPEEHATDAKKPPGDEALVNVEEESEEEEGEEEKKHEPPSAKNEADKHETKPAPTAHEQAAPPSDKTDKHAEPAPVTHAEADKPAAHGGEASTEAKAADVEHAADTHAAKPSAEHASEHAATEHTTAPAADTTAAKPSAEHASEHAATEHTTTTAAKPSAEHASEHAAPEHTTTPAPDTHAAPEHTTTPATEHAALEHAEAHAAPQKPEPPPPPEPPIGAVRHVKPIASEIRALLSMAQQPKKARAKASDPWEDTSMPTALESLRRSIATGETGTAHQISALRHYNGANPDDVHGHLLLAGLYQNRGWNADALDEYDMVYRIDSSARGAPEMLPHALAMVAHDEAADDATRFIVRVYQREALQAIERAIHDSRDVAASARLKKLRARVQSGR